MNVNKKRRAYNSYEIDILLACVNQKKSVIENKMTNAITNREKTAAWEAICREFNNVIGVRKCSVQQLQNLYRNTKRKSTKKAAEYRACTFRTGGGQIPANELAPDAERMRVLRKPLPAPVDNDGIFEKSNNLKKECIVPEEGEFDCESQSTPSSLVPEVHPPNPTSSNSSSTMTPKSSLTSRFLTSYGNKVNQSEPATAKAANATHQIETRIAQIEEDIKFMKEKMNREMELNEEKFKIDMLMNKQKHEQHMQHDEKRFQMDKIEHEMKVKRFEMEKEEHELKIQLMRTQLQKIN